MFGIIGKVASWFFGKPLDALTKAYTTYKSSAIEEDKVKAGVIAKQIDAQVEAGRSVTVIRAATAGFWEMRLLTAIFAGGCALHFTLIIIDTCFTSIRWGIPPLPEPFATYEGYIILSFFGVYAGLGGATALAAAFISRR